MFDYTNNKIYIHRKQFKPLYIGLIENNTLIIHDKDNYYSPMHGLGIDYSVLQSPNLPYIYIQMKYRDNKLLTTRKYFWDHAKAFNLLNGRKILFLPIKDFGLDKATQYNNLRDPNKLVQLDIFDIAKENDPKLLDLWIKSMIKQESERKKEVEL